MLAIELVRLIAIKLVLHARVKGEGILVLVDCRYPSSVFFAQIVLDGMQQNTKSP